MYKSIFIKSCFELLGVVKVMVIGLQIARFLMIIMVTMVTMVMIVLVEIFFIKIVTQVKLWALENGLADDDLFISANVDEVRRSSFHIIDHGAYSASHNTRSEMKLLVPAHILPISQRKGTTLQGTVAPFHFFHIQYQLSRWWVVPLCNFCAGATLSTQSYREHSGCLWEILTGGVSGLYWILKGLDHDHAWDLMR